MTNSEAKSEKGVQDRTVRAMVRISVYYGLLVVSFAVLIWAFPWFTKAVTRSQEERVITDAITDTFGGVPLTDATSVEG